MVQPDARILIVGGEVEAREGYRAELDAAGYRALSRAGGLEPGDEAELVLVAGGHEGSRRDGFIAVLDAVTAARKALSSAAVVVCVNRTIDPIVVEAALTSGADDVLLCPTAPGVILARVNAGVDLARSRADHERLLRYGRVLGHIAACHGVTLDTAAPLHHALARLAEVVGWTRCALMLRVDERGLLLVGASDDPRAVKIPLDLARYPEVRAALESGESVLIEETARSALLGAFAGLAAEKGGQALLAVPLLLERKAVGVLLMRHRAVRPPLEPNALDFLRLAAAALSLVLQAGRVFEGLREQTRRMSLWHYQEERRARALEQYKDFFEAASDGMVVLDEAGVVLYVNRAAEQMTGYAREGLAGRRFSELVAEAQRAALEKVVLQVAGGANLEVFDLALATTSGEVLTVSVSSSPVLAEHAAAVLAVRDVTEARALEAELRKTKDFLERLIDSTVDGIISADLRGNILIFNQGAARLYGYAPDEVVGKLPVWKLYPEGVARQLMAEMRSAEHGGAGRLLQSRREILTKEGELVPVSLAASIVYENGREIATVGIVSDLRERIKIEQRLLQAQEKLVVTEKQALIAELAGTTAHELNQPLTSVMGYSELLMRKMSPDDVHFRTVDIILREAERMAEIVRKIGKITRYETKTYVGSTQILDLDKSTTDG